MSDTNTLNDLLPDSLNQEEQPNTQQPSLAKDDILYPELEQTPLKFAISKRNEWMVKQADYVFAYVNTHYGGAYNALLYTAKHNKPYMNLYSGNYELY